MDENTTRSFVVQVRNFFRWGMFDKGSVKRNYNLNASGRLQVNTPFETADLYAMQKAPKLDDLEFS